VNNETLRWRHQEGGPPWKARIKTHTREDGTSYLVAEYPSKYSRIRDDDLTSLQAKASTGLEVYRYSSDIGYRWIPPVGLTVTGPDLRHSPETGLHPRLKKST
jgi:hypothetical protein